MRNQLKLPTLLIITEDPSIRFWFEKHLDGEFFILHAEDKERTVKALNARLDLIVIDSALEKSEPLLLAKEISKLTQKHLVPILLITGRLKKSYRDQAQNAGITGFLSNQLDIEELRIKIAEEFKAASSRERIENVSSKLRFPKNP